MRYVKKIIFKLLPGSNIVNSERRELGLQVANFKERNQKQIQTQKHKKSIKNQEWLG